MLAAQKVIADADLAAIRSGLKRSARRSRAAPSSGAPSSRTCTSTSRHASSSSRAIRASVCTPAVRATTRSRPTCDSGCATRSAPSARCSRNCSSPSSRWPSSTPRPSCPASRICRWRSRCRSPTICWPTWICSRAMPSVWARSIAAPTACRSALPHSPVPAIRSTARRWLRRSAWRASAATASMP